MSQASAQFRRLYEKSIKRIKEQINIRSVRGSNELQNAAILVLRGKRNGRTYLTPGTNSVLRKKRNGRTYLATQSKRKYTASAAGEPPANRTGIFRMAWQVKPSFFGNRLVSPMIENSKTVGNHLLGELLENGTSKMAARPHHDKIKEKALPKIKRIYEEPYF
jgi:hypothetical protein